MSRTTEDRQVARQAAAPSITATALVGELALRLGNQLIVACAEHGVVLMPLKGLLLLGRWPSLRGRRDLVDIDVLVRSSDVEVVARVLRTLGFEETVRSSAGGTFSSDAWPLSIDIHRRLFPHGLFHVSSDGVFCRARRDESLFAGAVARMSDDDLFAHLIGHFVKGRGTFLQDTSLDDVRWLLKQSCFQLEDAERMGAHFRALGLHRAAGYVLAHESFRNEPVASAVVRSLRLSRADRTTIALARLGTGVRRGSPPWWTPHLLDGSLIAGAHSILNHADEAAHRLVGHVTDL